MEIKSMKPSEAVQTPEEDTPERRLQAALEAFDPTGKARLESLDKIAQKLADASRGLSSVEDIDDPVNNQLSQLKKASQDINMAVREARQVMTGMEQVVRNIIRDTVGVIQAIGINKSNMWDMNTKTESLRIALEDKGVIDKEDLQKAFTEKVKPALIKNLQEQGLLVKPESADETSSDTNKVD